MNETEFYNQLAGILGGDTTSVVDGVKEDLYDAMGKRNEPETPSGYGPSDWGAPSGGFEQYADANPYDTEWTQGNYAATHPDRPIQKPPNIGDRLWRTMSPEWRQQKSNEYYDYQQWKETGKAPFQPEKVATPTKPVEVPNYYQDPFNLFAGEPTAVNRTPYAMNSSISPIDEEWIRAAENMPTTAGQQVVADAEAEAARRTAGEARPNQVIAPANMAFAQFANDVVPLEPTQPTLSAQPTSFQAAEAPQGPTPNLAATPPAATAPTAEQAWALDFARAHGRAPTAYDARVNEEMQNWIKAGYASKQPTRGDWERLTTSLNRRGIRGTGAPEFVAPTETVNIPYGSPSTDRWQNYAYWEHIANTSTSPEVRNAALANMRASATANAGFAPAPVLAEPRVTPTQTTPTASRTTTPVTTIPRTTTTTAGSTAPTTAGPITSQKAEQYLLQEFRQKQGKPHPLEGQGAAIVNIAGQYNVDPVNLLALIEASIQRGNVWTLDDAKQAARGMAAPNYRLGPEATNIANAIRQHYGNRT